MTFAERHGRIVQIARTILYLLAAYCLAFSFWSYPVFIRDLVEYGRYLKSDTDNVCISEFCKKRWLAQFPNGRLGYVAWYNFSKSNKFENLKLTGQSENVVEEVFGKASSTKTHGKGAASRTYNYTPFPHVPSGQFQVHCTDGVIQSAEMFD